MTLREKLIVLRNQAGMSQMALAEQLDVSRQAVTRWESGATAPNLDKLKALAKIYNVSLDWLCNDDMDAVTDNVKPAEPVNTSVDQEPVTCKKENRNGKSKVMAIILVFCIAVSICIWLAIKSNGEKVGDRQIDDLNCDIVDLPAQSENGFDFEWKD